MLAEAAAYAQRLSPASVDYWQRHAPRFRYFLPLVARLAAEQPLARVLDVGMGFQTFLLERLLPEARIDCLGVDPDVRFLPARPYTFHPANLNEIDPAGSPPAAAAASYDLVVFMEVVEHLVLPPEVTLAYLAAYLRPGGHLLVTTPNAAWIRNRLALLFGRNPFETLRTDRREMGHIREYTRAELAAAFHTLPMQQVLLERTGLYRFRQAKDNFLSACVDRLCPAMARTLVALYRKD